MAEKPNEIPEDLIAAGAVSNVAQYLKGLNFPADKRTVMNWARESGADQSALDEIKLIPERTYDTPMDLFKEIGDEIHGL